MDLHSISPGWKWNFLSREKNVQWLNCTKTSIKENWFALELQFCSVYIFEMCAFKKKKLDNVLPVNEDFQNTSLHSQRG